MGFKKKSFEIMISCVLLSDILGNHDLKKVVPSYPWATLGNDADSHTVHDLSPLQRVVLLSVPHLSFSSSRRCYGTSF